MINRPFCPDNTILVGFSGSFDRYPLSSISGHHHGGIGCLTRREIHDPYASVELIARVVRVQGMPKIEAFPTDLAVHGNIAPAIQHQAMDALVFPYKRVRSYALPGRISTVHADKKSNVPVVMTRRAGAPLSRVWTEPPTCSPNSSTGAGGASGKQSGSGSRPLMSRGA